jgi:hypothetical protein
MVHLWAVIGVAEVRTLTLYKHAYGRAAVRVWRPG